MTSSMSRTMRIFSSYMPKRMSFISSAAALLFAVFSAVLKNIKPIINIERHMILTYPCNEFDDILRPSYALGKDLEIF